MRPVGWACDILERHPGRLLAAYWVFAFVLTHLPPITPKPPDAAYRVTYGDKVLHFVGYTVLAFLLAFYLRHARRWHAVPAACLTIAVCSVYGAFDEITQPLVGRDLDVWDWLADLAGTLAGTAVAMTYFGVRGRRVTPTP